MSSLPTAGGVLLIVPTHDHASTLRLAVLSALEQTVTDLDLVVIGDGVRDDTREVVNELVAADDRVRFVDQPKSPSRAESTRHEVISASGARIVTYLGDDDLLLPDHVETMEALLDDHDFAHPFPIVIDDDDRLRAYPTDLGDPRCVAWHLQPGHNTVSLTGAAHTTDAYRRTGGWQPPPPGRWSDHFMWEQFLRLPEIRVATARRATTIKPPAALHRGVDPATRRTLLERWWDRLHEPDFRAWWDAEVADAVRRSAIESYTDHVDARERAHELHRQLHELTGQARELGERSRAAEAEADGALAELELVRAELELVRATRTWRLHDRVTALPLLRRLLARRPD